MFLNQNYKCTICISYFFVLSKKKKKKKKKNFGLKFKLSLYILHACKISR